MLVAGRAHVVQGSTKTRCIPVLHALRAPTHAQTPIRKHSSAEIAVLTIINLQCPEITTTNVWPDLRFFSLECQCNEEWCSGMSKHLILTENLGIRQSVMYFLEFFGFFH